MALIPKHKTKELTDLASYVFNFGRYRGRSFKEIWEKDQSYCLWANREGIIKLPLIKSTGGIGHLAIDMALKESKKETDQEGFKKVDAIRRLTELSDNDNALRELLQELGLPSDIKRDAELPKPKEDFMPEQKQAAVKLFLKYHTRRDKASIRRLFIDLKIIDPLDIKVLTLLVDEVGNNGRYVSIHCRKSRTNVIITQYNLFDFLDSKKEDKKELPDEQPPELSADENLKAWFLSAHRQENFSSLKQLFVELNIINEQDSRSCSLFIKKAVGYPSVEITNRFINIIVSESNLFSWRDKNTKIRCDPNPCIPPASIDKFENPDFSHIRF
jgi:hypothetical protein